jgi:hypothetical protein
MSTLETVIGALLVLLPFVISAIARRKGRSPFIWGSLSLVLTPFGSLILLLMLPEPDRGAAGEANRRSTTLGTLPGTFARIALGDQAEAARHAELDDKLATEARDARVDQLIAERLNALKAAPGLNTVPTGVAAAIKPTFGKRR